MNTILNYFPANARRSPKGDLCKQCLTDFLPNGSLALQYRAGRRVVDIGAAVGKKQVGKVKWTLPVKQEERAART